MTYLLQALRQEWAQFSQWTEKKASVIGEEKTEERTPANKVGEVIGSHLSWIKNDKPLEVIGQCDIIWHILTESFWLLCLGQIMCRQEQKHGNKETYTNAREEW